MTSTFVAKVVQFTSHDCFGCDTQSQRLTRRISDNAHARHDMVPRARDAGNAPREPPRWRDVDSNAFTRSSRR
eukprot:5394835-Lingulodinium_polyedra.AAC.1